MKNVFKITTALGSIVAGSFLLVNSSNQVSAKSYRKAVTKIAGNGNYAIYHNVSGSGPSGKFTSTKYFKHGQIQSKQSASTKKGTFWEIIVDGRTVGWVSEKFFARNEISVANSVSLVKNSSYSFPTRDVINFVTDSHGTAIDPSKVSASKAYISTEPAKVEFKYGKAKASVNIDVRTSEDGTGNTAPKAGFKAVSPWKGGSKGSSHKWNAAHGFKSETSSSVYHTKGMTLRTRLFEPRFVSLGYGQSGDKMGQVGVIPEGITVGDGVFTTSMFTNNSDQHGHLVSYNLRALHSKYAAQNLTTMSWGSFKSYAKNIKVSPYIKLGHGQSLGSSSSNIYVLANDNNYNNGPKSEEVFQVRKSDMKINKIWTIRIGADRYIHNATFVGDNTMYALFHNGGYNKYEYWKLTRNGDSWNATQVGATKGNFVNNNSPVQGFAYGNGHFYIGYNDYIFKVAENGAAQAHYHLNTRRETEGLSYDGRLYVGLAQRAELLTAN